MFDNNNVIEDVLDENARLVEENALLKQKLLDMEKLLASKQKEFDVTINSVKHQHENYESMYVREIIDLKTSLSEAISRNDIYARDQQKLLKTAAEQIVYLKNQIIIANMER